MNTLKKIPSILVAVFISTALIGCWVAQVSEEAKNRSAATGYAQTEAFAVMAVQDSLLPAQIQKITKISQREMSDGHISLGMSGIDDNGLVWSIVVVGRYSVLEGIWIGEVENFFR